MRPSSRPSRRAWRSSPIETPRSPARRNQRNCDANRRGDTVTRYGSDSYGSTEWYISTGGTDPATTDFSGTTEPPRHTRDRRGDLADPEQVSQSREGHQHDGTAAGQ